jgi:uncharacterized damage-inducible protein DinB
MLKRGKAVTLVALLATTLIAAGSAVAQAPAAAGGPLTKSLQGTLGYVKGNITKAAEQMPEANYAFQPTPDVRSFGQLIGHIADANFGICSTAAGEKPPAPGGQVEKTLVTKADLQKALADSFTYCDKVFAGLTDAQAVELVPFFGGQQMPKLAVLAFNTSHDFEHYGNIVTYLRLKGLVPPSSQH